MDNPVKPLSPCVKRCALAACQAICTGCGRTRDEIAGWGRMTDERRRQIMDGLPDRVRLLGIAPLEAVA